MRSKLISCEPFLKDDQHLVVNDYFIYFLEFENGTTGFKKSLKPNNPYIIGAYYNYELLIEGERISIIKMKLKDEIQLSFDYINVLQSATVFAIHTLDKPTIDNIHEITVKMLNNKDVYIQNTTE